MKIWTSYGSEHSANLVMIGTFKDEPSAEKAHEHIEELSECVRNDDVNNLDADRYSDAVFSLLEQIRFHSLSPRELEQFSSEVRTEIQANQVVITTDEMEVSAFLKLLVERGARVEVYSAHDHSDPDS